MADIIKTKTHLTTENDLPNESWVDLPLADGAYSISTYGRFYSHKREVKCKDGRIMTVGGRMLKVHASEVGNTIKLGSCEIKKNWYVPTLMCAMFMRDKKDGEVVNHINGNKWDDRIENLELTTWSESVYNDFDHGKRDYVYDAIKKARKKQKEEGSNVFKKGAEHINAVLTEEKVLEIRDIFEKGEMNEYELAEEYDVSRSCIHHVVSRRWWTHI